MRQPGPRRSRSRHGRRTHTGRFFCSRPRLARFLNLRLFLRLLGGLLDRAPRSLSSLPEFLRVLAFLFLHMPKVVARMLHIDMVRHLLSPTGLQSDCFSSEKQPRDTANMARYDIGSAEGSPWPTRT